MCIFTSPVHQTWISKKETEKQIEYSLPCLDLSIEIQNCGSLCAKLYDKMHDFEFPIVNFPLLSTIYQQLQLMTSTFPSCLRTYN